MSSREIYDGTGEALNVNGRRVEFDIYKKGRTWRICSVLGNKIAHPSVKSVSDAVHEAEIVFELFAARLIRVSPDIKCRQLVV